MHHRFTVDVDAEPERVFAVLADLANYDELLDIVHRVEPTDDAAWLVTLRAKIGPFARSKRLRMVRSEHQPTTAVRFERAELDGRDHSAWALESSIAPAAEGSAVTMSLAYDGRLWSSVLDGVLKAQITKATTNLQALATR